MTPTPTTPTRSKRSASRLAACTMMDESPLPGSRNESLLACPKAAGDGPVRGCGHVLNQRVTCPALISNPSVPSLWAELEKPIDEAANPLLDRSLGPEPHGALEVGCIRIGLRDVAGLHRKQLRRAGLAVACSISRTTSVTSTGLLLPML